jgi:hypothetical protein
MLKITVLAGLGLLLFFNNTRAQDEGTRPPLGERLGNRAEELMEMSRLGQTYQSTDMLSYDISYDFADSANPAVKLEHRDGKYGLYDNLFWGIIDSTMEYVQGHQYYVVADHDTKTIYIYDKLDYARVINVPLLDSLFNEVALQDLVLTRPGGVYKKLTIKYMPDMQYRQIEMVYDSTTYLLSSIAYYYNTTLYSQAYINCADSVTSLVVPATGVAMPGTVTCSSLTTAYRNFLAEFPNHTQGATVHMYVTGTGAASLNSSQSSYASATTKQTDNEIKELWIVPQSVSGIGKPLTDTIKPPVPSKKMMRATTLAATGGWVDSLMTARQLFEWYMNAHLGVQYTGDVYVDWLVNQCGYTLNQLPWGETAIVRQDTLQNIWNRFAAQYPASQLTITETVSVPVIKGITSNTINGADINETEYLNAMDWTSGSWYKTRAASTYDLSVLPRNASIQSAYLSLYAFAPSYRYAPHFRYASQSPYMEIHPVKGIFIPGQTSVDLCPEDYSGLPVTGLPVLSTGWVDSGNPSDFWSNQDYPNQDVASMVAAMYNTMQTTGVNYPVQYRLNDESFDYKAFYFGGVECSDVTKRPVLNVSYSASRCDVFTAFVNKALGTWLNSDQVKELFKYSGKLDISSDCTAATPGLGCDGEPGPGRPITGVTTISFNKTDETTFDLNLFSESRFFYKEGNTFYPQSNYAGYTVTPVFGNN